MNYKVKESYTQGGTSLQGYMTASYDALVEAFGEPQYTETSGDGKVDVEWNLKITEPDFGEEHEVTIYNWKDYDGGLTARTQQDYNWHVGGRSTLVSVYIKEAFEELMAEAA